MFRWRAKFVFLLMVYAAGFATAIYFLAPTSEQAGPASNGKPILTKTFDTESFTQSVNTGLHKCVDLTKDIAEQASSMIKEKLQQRQARADRSS